MGAEQLLGSGDMLLLENGANIKRLHGGFISESEVEKVVEKIVEKPIIQEKIIEKEIEVPKQIEKKVFVHVPFTTDDPEVIKKGPMIYNDKDIDKGKK